MKGRQFAVWVCCFAMIGFFIGTACAADEPIRILFLTKSQGFEHSVVHRENGQLSHAEKIMQELAAKNNLKVEITKNASTINKENLKNYDVVQFYTTGDLTQPSKDGGDGMGPDGMKELLNWVKNGGGFAGMHTCTDTFHENEIYRQLSGGVFATHKNQEKATLTVIKNPITAGLPEKWTFQDEWYAFKDVIPGFQPLTILETKGMEQEFYKNLEPYANSYIKELDKGRIFDTAIGHREDVWSNPEFQQFLVNGLKWAAHKM